MRRIWQTTTARTRNRWWICARAGNGPGGNNDTRRNDGEDRDGNEPGPGQRFLGRWASLYRRGLLECPGQVPGAVLELNARFDRTRPEATQSKLAAGPARLPALIAWLPETAAASPSVSRRSSHGLCGGPETSSKTIRRGPAPFSMIPGQGRPWSGSAEQR